jgi:DNA-binding transcriptional regulator YiaG
MQLGILQPEAARMLGVSTVTLSRWECDKVYPTPEFHQSIIAYLGHDPFVSAPHPELKNLRSNESLGVANLSRAERIGLAIKQCRLERKLTGKECAATLGVDAKTLRDWERGRHRPIGYLRERISAFVNCDLC